MSRPTDMTEEGWVAFGRALTEALARSGKSQTVVAQAIGVSTSTISNWKLGKATPDRPALTFALEREVGAVPGELSVHLGYIPPGATSRSWEAALIHDPEIDEKTRGVLLAVIRAMKGSD